MKTETSNEEITLKALCEQSNIPASLIRAVVRQMGGWENFTQAAPDICRGGIDGGLHGFIYNRDTEAFAKRNRADIASMASHQAKEFGQGVIEMLRGFGCFRQYQPSKNGGPIGKLIVSPTDEEIGMALYAGKEAEDSLPILNALAWYAGEEVSREYCRATGQD